MKSVSSSKASSRGKGREGEGRTAAHVLLVRKNEQQAVAHLPVSEDPLELGPRLVNPLPVGRVDDED